MKKPELLAPVGSWDSLVAAVANGADAVYLGGKKYSARQYAENFGPDELKSAVNYAHVRGVRVLVTVNTLIADSELKETLEYLKFLYDINVDAVIIQDLGLARAARKVLPELKLHASTQMTVHNLPGVELLAAEGFKRVVLSREMSLENIKEITEKSPVDIEVFIHGALCISYSGQCLMSSLIGGRSGNRGRCAQPCRLAYTLVDGEGNTLIESEKVGKHLLSPKDLNMIEHLPDLIRAGISSFKIEGRMKRPEYVATVTGIYRTAIDRFFENPEKYFVAEEEKKDLWQIFNRGFTTGYFYSNQGPEMMSYKRPNNRGLLLGRIIKFDQKTKKAQILLEESLRPGDGIEAWVTRGGREGLVVDRITVGGKTVEAANPGEVATITVPGKVRPGDRVFKTYDVILIEKARETFEGPKAGLRIPVDISVTVKEGEPLNLIFRDDLGNEVTARTEFHAEKAIKRPLTEELIFTQIDRLGNTSFKIRNFHVDIQEGVMVPVSEINAARREAVRLLEEKRLKMYQLPPVDTKMFKKSLNDLIAKISIKDENNEKEKTGNEKDEIYKKPLLTAAVGDMISCYEALEAGADIIYLGLENFSSKKPVSVNEIKEAGSKFKEQGKILILSPPRVLQKEEMEDVYPYLELVKEDIQGLQVANLGLWKVALEAGIKELYTDYPLNIYNSQALKWFEEKGARQVTLSPELTMEQVGEICKNSTVPVEVLVHGSVPMIVSEYCLPGSVLGKGKKCSRNCRRGEMGLKDRLGMIFPVETDRYCHTYIFNPKELAMIDDLGRIISAGVTRLRLEMKKDKPGDVARVVKTYRYHLDRFLLSGGEYEVPGEVKENLLKFSKGGFTKGHYYRGVI